jgi:hypothetical protein
VLIGSLPRGPFKEKRPTRSQLAGCVIGAVGLEPTTAALRVWLQPAKSGPQSEDCDMERHEEDGLCDEITLM